MRRHDCTHRRSLTTGALVAALAALLASCATGSGPSDETPTGTDSAPPPPGAERWEEGALELPSRSPVVGVARLDALLENSRRFRSWIVDDPAMFGEDGDQFVRQFRSGWNQLSRRIGFDPLSEGTPGRVGLDGSRPMYVGLYPAAATGTEFVDRVESAVRESAGLESDESLGPALREMNSGDRETPSNLTSSVLEAVETSPTAGLRMVLPVSDATEFSRRLESAAKAVGYKAMSVEEIAELDRSSSGDTDGDRPKPKGFYSETSPWPAFLLRPDEEWLKIDILFRVSHEPSGGTGDRSPDRLRSSLGELLADSGSGRPAAPRPEERPALAVAIDQKRTGTFIRMQAYRKALQSAARAAVDRRNQAFVRSLSRAATVGEDWSRGSDILTGSSYALYGVTADRDADHIFRMTSTLYGPSPSRRPDIDSIDVGLGVDDRGFGMAVDFDPFFDSAWQEWLGLEDASKFTESSDITDTHPIPYAVSLPRNLAFVVASIDQTIREALPETVGEAYEQRHNLQRLEIATAGSDVQALRNQPKLVGLLTFDEDAAQEDIDAVLDTLPPLVKTIFDAANRQTSEDTSVEPPEASYPRGELESFDLDPSHPAHPFFYFAQPKAGRAFVFFSHGIDRGAAADAVDSIEQGDRSPMNDRAFFLRLEPATAVASLSAFDTEAFEPLQLEILAQRIGALVVSVSPREADAAQTLRYELELRRPPDL